MRVERAEAVDEKVGVLTRWVRGSRSEGSAPQRAAPPPCTGSDGRPPSAGSSHQSTPQTTRPPHGRPTAVPDERRERERETEREKRGLSVRYVPVNVPKTESKNPFSSSFLV